MKQSPIEKPKHKDTKDEKKHPAGTILDPHERPLGETAEDSRKVKIEIAGEELKVTKGEVTLDTSVEPKPKSSEVILDSSDRPITKDNPPTTARAKFTAEPTVKAERKERKESGVDSAKLKELEKKIRNLNEKYLSAVQREDKALLYSELEQAQKEYQKMQEEFEKNVHQSERDRKMAKLEALREIIRDLNERYLREPQREQKVILYSQLEAAQKEYRKLEEELDGTSSKKAESTPPGTQSTPEPGKTPEPGPEEKRKIEALRIEITILLGRVLNGDAAAISVLLVLLRSQTEVAVQQIIQIEVGLQTQLLILLEQAGGGDPAAINNLIIFITTNHTILHISIDNTPPITPASGLPLDDLRDMYLNAKRKRGNVVRGMFGRLFGRTLNFRGNNMDFGGEQGARDLETVRNEYQLGLERYRTAELRTLQANLSMRLATGMVTPAQANAEMQMRIVGLLNEEQTNIDTRSTQGVERNFFEKMKTGFRRKVWTRMGVGLGLAGVASLTGGTVVAAGAIGTGAALGAAGTYVGVEAGLERWSKTIGHRGGLLADMRREVARRRAASPTGHSVDMYIASIPANEIREEAARLRMLQVEKGVSIDRLRTSGDNGEIAALIIRRDNELTAQEAMANAHLENPALGFAGMLSARLARETNCINTLVESEVDSERRKKMARKTIAMLAGGTVGWLTMGQLFKTPDVGPLPTPPPAPHLPISPGIGPVPIPPDMFHTVTGGENLWKIIESTPNVDHAMAGLLPEAKTHMIDALKDTYEKMSPSELISRGFHSGVIDNLNPGDILNLDKIVDPGILAHALSNAQHLSPTDIASIMHNNSTIATWLANPTNHASLTGALNSSVIDQILAGTR